MPYVHCFNHQLHLVIAHAMSSENALANFFDVCSSLYKYFRKPTVAALYTGQKLKRLLEQRWAGHMATVTVIMTSFNSILSLLLCVIQAIKRKLGCVMAFSSPVASSLTSVLLDWLHSICWSSSFKFQVYLYVTNKLET